MTDELRLFGIDFSGDHSKWSARRSNSNIWIAEGRLQTENIKLQTLQPIQRLPGRGDPFQRLSDLLNSDGAGVAAIDAPFSLPAAFVVDAPEKTWLACGKLAADGRKFCRGAELVQAFASELGLRGQKRLRETERYWQGRRVNVRSTTWSGPRGGAPFAAACMTLLSLHKGAVWPLTDHPSEAKMTLVEAFPAAQLRHWELPYVKYNGATETEHNQRAIIIEGLKRKGLVAASEDDLDLCRISADALDAVICLFAAAAFARGRLAVLPGAFSRVEGHIVVHE